MGGGVDWSNFRWFPLYQVTVVSGHFHFHWFPLYQVTGMTGQNDHENKHTVLEQRHFAQNFIFAGWHFLLIVKQLIILLSNPLFFSFFLSFFLVVILTVIRGAKYQALMACQNLIRSFPSFFFFSLNLSCLSSSACLIALLACFFFCLFIVAF